MRDWVGERARRHGAALAVVADDGDATWTQLDAGAERAARRLAALGVRAGERVATTLGPGLAFVELLHAAPRVGAVLAPIDPRERRRLVELAAPRTVVDEPLDGPEERFARATPDPDRPRTLVFTSGTSGEPRPVLLTGANHEASALAWGERLGLGEGDVWLGVLPLFHVGGLAVLLRAAVHGSRVRLHAAWHEPRVCAALEAGDATHLSLVPTMLERLRRGGLRAAPGLRALLLGGAPAPPDLVAWAAGRGLPVLATYGMTQTASGIAAASPGAPAEPLPGVELRIASGGEVLVRGAMTAPGERDAEGWLRTGDLGALDPDGRLRVIGRARDLVISGGEKVSPLEVEEALLDHPAVREAVVAGRPDPDWGEAVTAWVVLDDPAVEDAALLAHAGARLAAHKVPKRVVRVAALPRGRSGKVLRRLL